MDIEPAAIDKLEHDLFRRPDESELEFTNRLRIIMAENMATKGLPEDPKDIYAFNAILDSIDRQAINKARIQVEDKQADSDKEAINIIGNLLARVGNNNPYEAKEIVERTVTIEGPVIEGVTTVPGELDHTPRQLNYDAFMKDYRQKNPKPSDDA